MDRLQRAVILTELMDQLHASGSWCGETHVQKAMYFLQELLNVRTEFEFILYKHGPYSFDLTADLTALRADFLMEFNHRSPGYGPGLVPTPTSKELRSRYPKTLDRNKRPIAFVAGAFRMKGVSELEKLATALFVTRQAGNTVDVTDRANRLHDLKPHVSLLDARAAVEELDRIAAEVESPAEETTHA